MAGESQREAMLTALSARLTDDAALTALAPGGIHLVRAPQGEGVTYPLVRVRMRPGGRIEQTIGNHRAARAVNVEVAGITQGAGTVEVERIDERLDALLADYLPSVASPHKVIACRRIADVDLPVIDPKGVEFDTVGGLYRIWMTSGAA